MKNNNIDLIRHKAVQRYISALDSGNLDEVQWVTEQALDDPILDEMLVEINQAVEQEIGLAIFAKDAALVGGLVNKHFDSRDQVEEFSEQLLTVGEVAARMQADRNIPPTDQSTHKILLNLSTQLPEFLNIQAIRKLAVELQVNASDKFWRVFRDTAIMMGIGRGQAQMSAARKQNTKKITGKENNHDKKVKMIKGYTDLEIRDLANGVWSKLDPVPETQGISPLFEMISSYPIRMVEINGLSFHSAANFLTAETGQIIPIPQDLDQPLAGFLFIQRYRKTFYGCILVEQRDLIVRRRFSAAHELGHYLLHFLPLLEAQSSNDDLILIEGLSYSKDSTEDLPTGRLAIIELPDNDTVFSFTDDEMIEREANRFAAELLIPEDACKSLYQIFSQKYGKKHLVLAKRLATEFLVSLEAMKWRLVALNLFDN